jgi:phosphopantothenoylcysteine decarboxylase/phosphopantothenate--cysteine ligase
VRGHVVLGVSGGIAAFRAVDLLRSLVKAGCRVTPILTRSAARFVSPRTFAVLARARAQLSLWSDPTDPGVDHVDLSRRADLLVVAPATANLIAKMATGIADDALTTYALAHRRSVVLAPAMNTVMWEQPATQAAVDVLKDRGAFIVPPARGVLADGEVGEGRLAAVEDIFAAVMKTLPPRGPLAGVELLVTAGPTREPLDVVRVLTNRSSGRMGAAIAAEAVKLGARVTVLAASGVAVPREVECERFGTADDLGRLLARHAPGTDLLFHAAAVADFRPREVEGGKLDRRTGGITVSLEPVPDLAAGLPREGGRPYLVIFAAESAADLEARAVAKLREKQADAVVANPIDEPGVGMESEQNRALVLTTHGLRRELGAQDKASLARELLFCLTPGALNRLRR